MIKHMAGIATLTYDLDGAKVFPQDPASMMSNNTGARRASRTATLDGGCVIYDTGYAAADRTLTIVTDIEYIDFFEHLVRYYSTVLVSTRDGLFKGNPRTWRTRNGKAEIEIFVTEEIDG